LTFDRIAPANPNVISGIGAGSGVFGKKVRNDDGGLFVGGHRQMTLEIEPSRAVIEKAGDGEGVGPGYAELERSFDFVAVERPLV
jgi:hypothetical protein